MRKKKIIGTTNLDNATPVQKEKFMKLLVEAHRILHSSVVKRKSKEFINQFT